LGTVLKHLQAVQIHRWIAFVCGWEPAGIVHVLRSLLAEADLIMAVDGYPSRLDLTPETLRRVT